MTQLTLNDVCELITCGVAKRPNYVDIGIPFLSAKNVKKQSIIWDDYQFISEETHAELTRHNKPCKGDILYTRVGSYGEAAIVDRDIDFSIFVSLTLIKPSNKILNSYLTYYLNSPVIKELAKKSISGSGVGNLNVGTVRKFKISLPSLPDQQKTVTKLDVLFVEIDKAVKATETNIKNAQALFQSYLKVVFEFDGECKKTVALGDVCKTSAGGTPLKAKKEYYDGGTIPWLLSGEVCRKEIFSAKNFITNKGVENSSAKIFPKDTTLIAMYGATAGQVSILRFPAATNQAVCGILPNKNYTPEFLYYFLSFYKETLLLEVSGVAQPNLSQIKIKNIPLPLIDVNQQNKLVSKLDAISIKLEKAAQLYKNKVVELTVLKQSILKQTFSGELVKE